MTGKTKTVGSKEEVYRGDAVHTSGGLTKSDLMKNTRGTIVSVKKHEAGQKLKAHLDKFYKAKYGK